MSRRSTSGDDVQEDEAWKGPKYRQSTAKPFFFWFQDSLSALLPKYYRTRREGDGCYPHSHLRRGVEEEEVHLHTAWNLLGNFAPVPHAAPKPFRYLHCYVFLVFEMPK